MDKERTPIRRRDRDIFEHFFDDIWSRNTIGSRFDVFDEFEDQFRRMQQRMNQLYQGALRGNIPDTKEGSPQIYGWTYRMSSDGKPVFQEFGNVPQTPLSKQNELPGSREPLIDVQESDKHITVIAEIPGVSKEDVDLEITKDSLIIRVDNTDRRYYKEVDLPAEINQESGDAKFNNGILSIELKKLKPKKKGTKLKVE